MDFRKILLKVVVCTLILACFSCDETVCTDCNGSGYSFQDSILIQPSTETISQGDTLWLSCEIPKTQKDLNTGNIVEYSNAKNISFVFKIQKILGKNSSDYFLDNFEVFIKDGIMIKNHNTIGALEVQPINEANGYMYKVALVPKKNIAKGIYFFFYSQIGGVYDSKGNNASYDIGLKCKDQHLNLYYDNMPDRPLASQFAKLTYCFGVTE
jgi:hypothetical protein